MSKRNCQQSLFDRIEGLEKDIHEMFQLQGGSSKATSCGPPPSKQPPPGMGCCICPKKGAAAASKQLGPEISIYSIEEVDQPQNAGQQSYREPGPESRAPASPSSQPEKTAIRSSIPTATSPTKQVSRSSRASSATSERRPSTAAPTISKISSTSATPTDSTLPPTLEPAPTVQEPQAGQPSASTLAASQPSATETRLVVEPSPMSKTSSLVSTPSIKKPSVVLTASVKHGEDEAVEMVHDFQSLSSPSTIREEPEADAAAADSVAPSSPSREELEALFSTEIDDGQAEEALSAVPPADYEELESAAPDETEVSGLEPLYEVTEDEAVSEVSEEMAPPPIAEIAKSLSQEADNLVALTDRSQQLILEQKERVQEVIEAREEKIRKLSDVVEGLEEVIVEKDIRSQQLQASNEQLREGLECMHQCNRLFAETTHKYKEEIETGTCCFAEMKRQVLDLQEEIRRAREEIVTMREKKDAPHPDATKARGSENKKQQQCCVCEKLKKIVREKDDEKQKTQEEFRQLEEKHQVLREKFNDVSCCYQQESSDVEGMLDVMNMLRSKEEKFQEEKQELKSLIRELQAVTNQHQKRAEQFLEINHQQEVFLQQKELELAAKCKQLKAAQDDAANYKRQSMDLQEQVSFSKGCSPKQLLSQVEELRTQLEDEKDTVALKDKVVEDQGDTIKQLSAMLIEKKSQLTDAREKIRRSLDATTIINEEVKWAEQQLRCLKAENCQLRCKLEAEQVDNKVLKKKIVELELNIQQHCKVRAEESANVKLMIGDLKNKFGQQQREWELNMELLAKQKDKAVNAAKFASNMLLQTINDFRKQMRNHQTIQETLSNVFRDKEPCLCVSEFTPQEMCNKFCRAVECSRPRNVAESISSEEPQEDVVDCCSCTDSS